MNVLYYGDNLSILREHIASGSVDLVDLDPPFNSSNRDYPRIQILTVEELLHGARIQMPPAPGTFKQADLNVEMEFDAE